MIKIICVGSIKEKYLNELIGDYFKRIKKYHKIEIVELKDSNKQEENKKIRDTINEKEYVIALDKSGVQINTIQFQEKIESLFNQSLSNITFIIGGSEGLEDETLKLCEYILSFSQLTFPHGLFRGILLEQIYRIFKIMNNETYHK